MLDPVKALIPIPAFNGREPCRAGQLKCLHQLLDHLIHAGSVTVADARREVWDHERSRRYIGTSLRVTLLLALAGESVITAAPQAIVRTVYPSKPEYLSEASVLIPLAAAYAVLCLLSVAITVVNASGRPFRSMTGAALAVMAQSAALLAFRD
jgi:hypothetical protein